MRNTISLTDTIYTCLKSYVLKDFDDITEDHHFNLSRFFIFMGNFILREEVQIKFEELIKIGYNQPLQDSFFKDSKILAPIYTNYSTEMINKQIPLKIENLDVYELRKAGIIVNKKSLAFALRASYYHIMSQNIDSMARSELANEVQYIYSGKIYSGPFSLYRKKGFFVNLFLKANCEDSVF